MNLPASSLPPAPAVGDASLLHRHDRDFLLGLYERLVLIREFEERVKFLFLEGTMPGTIHQCQGQEATRSACVRRCRPTISSPRRFAAMAMPSRRA